MATVRYREFTAYLVADRYGTVKTLKRVPKPLGPTEYVFAVRLRVPYVDRPAVAGEVVVELPIETAADAEPSIEVGAEPLVLTEGDRE